MIPMKIETLKYTSKGEGFKIGYYPSNASSSRIGKSSGLKLVLKPLPGELSIAH